MATLWEQIIPVWSAYRCLNTSLVSRVHSCIMMVHDLHGMMHLYLPIYPNFKEDKEEIWGKMKIILWGLWEKCNQRKIMKQLLEVTVVGHVNRSTLNIVRCPLSQLPIVVMIHVCMEPRQVRDVFVHHVGHTGSIHSRSVAWSMNAAEHEYSAGELLSRVVFMHHDDR